MKQIKTTGKLILIILVSILLIFLILQLTSPYILNQLTSTTVPKKPSSEFIQNAEWFFAICRDKKQRNGLLSEVSKSFSPIHNDFFDYKIKSNDSIATLLVSLKKGQANCPSKSLWKIQYRIDDNNLYINEPNDIHCKDFVNKKNNFVYN